MISRKKMGDVFMRKPDYKYDYPEDLEHENGNYVNSCLKCRVLFIGYKRRMTCRSCFEKSKSVSLKDRITYFIWRIIWLLPPFYL